MEQQLKRKQEDAAALRKKAIDLMLPIFLEKSENVLDATIWANTLSQKLQEMAADRAVSMKVEEFEKDLRLNTTAKHGERYEEVIDRIKGMQVKEAVQLLAELKLIINEGIERKFAKEKLKEFLEEKKSNIILT